VPRFGEDTGRRLAGPRVPLVMVARPAAAPEPELPGALPAPPTPLVGREREVAQAQQLLQQPNLRLLSMTGPGGVGKTRLAIEVAMGLSPGFPDGVFFVSLAAVADPGLVAAVIAQTLELKEAAASSLWAGLKTHLRPQHVLLLLDNFEQVIAAATLVAELLAAAPQLKILVTSREVLHIRGEHEFPVPPLALPDKDHLPAVPELTHTPAIALFVQCARAVKADFAITADNAATVAAICARLDGLPLAIELAAARAKLLPPAAMLARLAHPLHVLTGGARDLPVRQQTLRDTLRWSYDLLTPMEQHLFCGLAVFAGGCTLEAAGAVVAPPAPSAPAPGADAAIDLLEPIGSLVDKSLLRQAEGPGGELYLRMLATVREYALERLAERGAVEAIQRRHAAYYLAFVEAAAAELSGPQQGPWLERLEIAHDNLRAALHWSIAQDGAATALQMLGVLWRFWEIHGHLSEGRQWLEAALQAGTAAPAALRAAALHGGSRLAWLQGDYPLARRWTEESLALSRALGNRKGIAQALHALAILAGTLGEAGQAQTYYEESLALWRELGNKGNVARLLNSLGVVARSQGDYARAQTLFAESQALQQELGNQRSVALAQANLGFVALAQGAYAPARALFTASLERRQALGYRVGIVDCLTGLAALADIQGDARRAVCLFSVVAAWRANLGYTLEIDDQAVYDHHLAAARRQLDAGQAAAAWQEGQLLTLEEASALALAPPAEMPTPPAGDSHPAEPPARPGAPGSPAEFAAATHDLLRNYARPYALQNSPLLRTRYIAAQVGAAAKGTQRVAALQGFVKAACETLQHSPHDVKLYRAVYHMYIQPAATQEQAAELLDLPISTFRRHLRQGIARVAEVMWQWETEGAGE